ncbi:MAG TPA: hypothetical protein VIY51_10070 [Xanthobacteraceae bacterium]
MNAFRSTLVLRLALAAGAILMGSHGFRSRRDRGNLYFAGGSTKPGGSGLTDRRLMFTLP